jgi:hypothetical protein
MSTAGHVNNLSAQRGGIVVLVMFFLALPAKAQDLTHMPTLADCPAGYVLAVQDMALPQPLTKPPPTAVPAAINADDANSIAAQNTMAAAEATQQAEAPRQFMTGCIPPPVQPNR